MVLTVYHLVYRNSSYVDVQAYLKTLEIIIIDFQYVFFFVPFLLL